MVKSNADIMRDAAVVRNAQKHSDTSNTIASFCVQKYNMSMIEYTSSLAPRATRINGQSSAEDLDAQLAIAIAKLKLCYAKQLDARASTKFIPPPAATVEIEPVLPAVPAAPVQKSNAKVYCSATKMDGNKCTAKAKPGCTFCGRHMPKITT